MKRSEFIAQFVISAAAHDGGVRRYYPDEATKCAEAAAAALAQRGWIEEDEPDIRSATIAELRFALSDLVHWDCILAHNLDRNESTCGFMLPHHYTVRRAALAKAHALLVKLDDLLPKVQRNG